MKPDLQPIYLLADSQLLFWRGGANPFLDSVGRLAARGPFKAAYVGASNGDAPEFYSVFEAAMEGAGVRDCRMILRSFAAADQSFLKEAGLVLLAGGDVERGWRVFAKTGMRELIARRYAEGAVLAGVSAGAVQLGLYGAAERRPSGGELLRTFGLVPFVVDAHDEARQWAGLRRTVRLLGGEVKGVGIPTGGGAIYHPDGRVEAVRHPVCEFSTTDGREVRAASLSPKRKGARDCPTN